MFLYDNSRANFDNFTVQYGLNNDPTNPNVSDHIFVNQLTWEVPDHRNVTVMKIFYFHNLYFFITSFVSRNFR